MTEMTFGTTGPTNQDPVRYVKARVLIEDAGNVTEIEFPRCKAGLDLNRDGFTDLDDGPLVQIKVASPLKAEFTFEPVPEGHDDPEMLVRHYAATTSEENLG